MIVSCIVLQLGLFVGRDLEVPGSASRREAIGSHWERDTTVRPPSAVPICQRMWHHQWKYVLDCCRLFNTCAPNGQDCSASLYLWLSCLDSIRHRLILWSCLFGILEFLWLLVKFIFPDYVFVVEQAVSISFQHSSSCRHQMWLKTVAFLPRMASLTQSVCIAAIALVVVVQGSGA